VKDEGKEETRVVLRFSPRIAPIKAAVFPLLKNKPELVAIAKDIYKTLQPLLKVTYADTAAIGRRYRRMDEVGTPFGITVDFETLEGAKEASTSATGTSIAAGQKDTVTLRHRDSMKQERIAIADLPAYLVAKIVRVAAVDGRLKGQQRSSADNCVPKWSLGTRNADDRTDPSTSLRMTEI